MQHRAFILVTVAMALGCGDRVRNRSDARQARNGQVAVAPTADEPERAASTPSAISSAPAPSKPTTPAPPERSPRTGGAIVSAKRFEHEKRKQTHKVGVTAYHLGQLEGARIAFDAHGDLILATRLAVVSISEVVPS